MGKCDGYCRSEDLREQHDQAISQAVRLLEGRFQEVRDDLTAEMERAAEELRFEQAAQLRDRLRAIELLGQTAEGGGRLPGGHRRGRLLPGGGQELLRGPPLSGGGPGRQGFST